MKSLISLMEKYNVTEFQLLKALRNACSYYLSEDEIEQFILKQVNGSRKNI